MLTETVPATPAKRLKKRTVIVTVLVSLAVVVAALWAVDTWARQQAADYVGGKVRELLALESTEPVTVEIAGLSIIAQVLTGELERVDVDVDDVTIGDFTGGVELRAEGVPIDLKKPVDSVQIEFTVGEESIQKIAHVLSASSIDEVKIVEPEIQFSSEFSFFGFTIDVGVGIEPYAEDGEIGFTPTSISLNGNRTSATALSEQFGSVAAQLLQTRTVCVAGWLPEALTLDDVAVRDDELIITIGARSEILDESALSTMGSCPGQ